MNIIEDVERLSQADLALINKKLTSNRYRQLRLNLAYKNSDISLDAAIKSVVGDAGYKLHIRHHSHQLNSLIKNAMRYNQERTNGVTIVVLESPALARPVFGYSVCSVQDTYSRLIGRTQAKEHLLNTLTQGAALVLPVGNEDHVLSSATRDTELHRYINFVVAKVAPRKKAERKGIEVSPLLFVNEDSLNLEVKQLISKKFGVDTKDIQNNFVFVRRFNNKFFGNQFATYANIQKYDDLNPHDTVSLDSTGGFTVGVFTFAHEGVDHLLYATTHCSPEDHFNKTFGRKSVMLAIKASNIFKTKPSKDRQSKLAGVFRLSEPMDKNLMLDQLALHAVTERYGVTINTYVGGVVS